MCEYCNEDGKEHEILIDSNIRWYTKILSNGLLYLYCEKKGQFISNGISIPHCPMCGRKLTETESKTEMKPIIHAHAIIDWCGDAECSNCGAYINTTEPYCQHCGADLDEPIERED